MTRSLLSCDLSPMSNVDTTGLTRAEVMFALANGARLLGRNAVLRITVEQAACLDYIWGLISDGENSFDPQLYDCNAGEGEAQRAIDAFREYKAKSGPGG